MRSKFLIFCFIPFFIACVSNEKQNTSKQNIYTGIYTGNEVTELTTKLAKGWNTWNTRSVLSHVLLPEGFAINLQLKDIQSGDTLKEALIGRRKADLEHVIPGPHAYDGSYTELMVEWRDIHIKVQSASVNEDFYLLISPINASSRDSLIINPQILWNKKGYIETDKGVITGQFPSNTINVFIDGNQLVTTSEGIMLALNKTVAVSTETNKPVEEIENIINGAKTDFEAEKSKYNEASELYNSMQTVLAWDVIYEPTHDRVITPVSRIWNCGWGGWVLFDWDTYFASYMLSLDNKELAYSNAIAITKEFTKNGFIPNFAAGICKSEDRSQPPVGSLVVKEIYKKYKEKWFLYEVFDELLRWNRWWENNRDVDGYLCWGSDPYNTEQIPGWLRAGVGKRQGAMWESGLDNSPMYDEAPFDTTNNILMLADVGLMSIYISDCQSLAEIAGILGKPDIEKELNERGEKYTNKLKTLWDDEFGLYLNKDLVTGKFSYRLSPTLFYPLLAKVPDQIQAKRMMDEHFYNSEEFWGEYIIPSIARNDVAFKDNDYWRGRIWAPMNFLVYLGIRNYELPDAKKDLIEKSKSLILKSWINENHVYENYNSETGQGDDVKNSDKFYHWGALLSYIGMIDEGYVISPQLPLKDNE